MVFAAEASPPTSHTFAEQLCIAKLERYPGQPYDQNPFEFYYLYPRAATWVFGDDLRLGRVDGYFESPRRSRNVTAPVWIA